MIPPQVEQRNHGAAVVGMFVFDDNTHLLREGNPLGERLAGVAREPGILLMRCERCAHERGPAAQIAGTYCPAVVVASARIGCFPDVSAALAGHPPDQVITR